MRISLYAKLARSSLKKNREVVFPFVLSSSLIFGIVFILRSIYEDVLTKNDPLLAGNRITLEVGLISILFFSIIFLFYSCRFLAKRRQMEIAVYRILGMEKKHLLRFLVIEMGALYIRTVFFGSIFAVAFFKIIERLMARISQIKGIDAFVPSLHSFTYTALIFAVMFTLMLVYRVAVVAKNDIIELSRGAKSGEKIPKTNLPLSIIGIACLAGGYYLAVTVVDIRKLFTMFLLAVILVIIGTYCCFTALSVFMLKAVQKNKKVYYKPKNITAVSGLIYRIKQNAGGLASICILASAFLVSLSTGVSMYIGAKSSIKVMEKYDLVIGVRPGEKPEEKVIEEFREKFSEEGLKIVYENKSSEITCLGVYEGDRLIFVDGQSSRSGTFSLKFNYYDDIDGNLAKIFGDSDIIYLQSTGYDKDKMIIGDRTYKVKKLSKKEKKQYIKYSADVFSSAFVVKDRAVFDSIYKAVKSVSKNDDLTENYGFKFDEANTKTTRDKVHRIIKDMTEDKANRFSHSESFGIKEDIMSVLGGFFFLSIVVGSVFMIATGLIIYYKQLTEGYEDRARYGIMRSVGMSDKMVRASINSQIKMVFFMPLIMTGIHMAFAFPMVKRMVEALGFAFMDVSYYEIALLCFALFGFIYLVMYILTSRVYYGIVSSGMRRESK